MALLEWWTTQRDSKSNNSRDEDGDEEQSFYRGEQGRSLSISQDYVIISDDDDSSDQRPRKQQKKKMFKRRHYQGPTTKTQRNNNNDNNTNNNNQQAFPSVAGRTENDHQVFALLADSLQCNNRPQGIQVVRRKQLITPEADGNASSDDNGEQENQKRSRKQSFRRQSFRRRGRAMSDNSDGMSAADTGEEDTTAASQEESMDICYGQYWWQA